MDISSWIAHWAKRLGAPEAASPAELLRAEGRTVTAAPPPLTALDVLSQRQSEVLALLAQGPVHKALHSVFPPGRSKPLEWL
jgi:hypothetical protein